MSGMSRLSSSRRYIFIALALILGLHFILSISHEGYGQASSFRESSTTKTRVPPARMQGNLMPNETHFIVETTIGRVAKPAGPRRANATFVILARNSDLDGVLHSMRSNEERFNRNYDYPYVLLNEVPFTEEFIRRATAVTHGTVSFGQIPAENWYQPDWIDEDLASQGRREMESQGIIYAGSVPYRNMCRFNSGFFFRHELLQPYRYYWRIEPDVEFNCGLNYDPFIFMEDNNKVYSERIRLMLNALTEWEPTISTLWSTVKEFITEHPQYLADDNAMKFLSDDGGQTYNLCHYWSNFEIADLDFWRGEAYTKFFDYLESKGGFYYERWGDAPVHSIAASLFARKDQTHFFDDIGYSHPPFEHCPSGDAWSAGHCACSPSNSIDHRPNSCLKRFRSLFN
ncbi:glycosyltransferase family 15 protein [Athelia psychrophila]|uniref:Glycosyltransferase family 15 protein n=1 Tax=Athelia psychrophila TaxID=1759441 RepID=A0A166UC48_9AGAM|nr:glycosyltransferase family 15 protein [Fibularhizoctonia sp. CBS 109695]